MALPKLLIPAVAFLGLSGAALYYIPCAMGPCDGAPALAEHDNEDEAAPCEEPCEPPCGDEKALAAVDDAELDEEPCPMAAKRQAEALAAVDAEQAQDEEPCPCPGKKAAEGEAEVQLAANAPVEAAAVEPNEAEPAAAEPKS